jgi:LuxR family maltose regulon positive regulatory protein
MLHYPVTLVSAPPGYGKSTLLASWLASGRFSPAVGWFAIDPADNDPARFWRYLQAAIMAFPGCGQALADLLELPGPLDPEQAGETLAHDLSTVDRPAVLALDDYHLIANPELHRSLEIAVAQWPALLHLVIGTREDPPLPLARLRVRRRLLEIRAAQLAFTEEEAAALLAQAGVGALPPLTVPQLMAQTEGWAAGLQLSALVLRDGPSPAAHPVNAGHRFVFDYLAEEVLDRQPEPVRHFLAATAPFDRISAGLCVAAGITAGEQEAAAMLRRLQSANLFLAPLDGEGRWYRYHALFRDVLRSRPDPRQRERQQQAARWFWAERSWEEAIEQAHAAADTTLLASIIEAAAGELLNTGAIGQLIGWLALLPEDQIAASASLLAIRAWTGYLSGQLSQAEADLAQTLALMPGDAAPADRAPVLALQCFLASSRGNLADAIEYAYDALDQLGDREPEMRAVVLLNLAQAQYWLGEPAAIVTAAESLRLAEQQKSYFAAANALGIYSQLLAMRGDLLTAIHLCEQMVARHRAGDGRLLPLAGLPALYLGMFYAERYRLAEATELLMAGMALCQQSAVAPFVITGQLALISALASQGTIQQALNVLAEGRALGATLDVPHYYVFLEVEVRLWAGQSAEAHRLLTDHGPQPPFPLHHSRESLALLWLRVLLAQGVYASVAQDARQLATAAQREGRLERAVKAWALEISALLGTGDEAAALQRLRSILPDADHAGFLRCWVEAPLALDELLRAARPVAPAFVDEILRLRGAHPAGAATGALPEPLTPKERDVLALMAAGLSNPEIAVRLVVTTGTVKTHVHHLIEKLRVRNRVEAISRGKDLGLID